MSYLYIYVESIANRPKYRSLLTFSFKLLCNAPHWCMSHRIKHGLLKSVVPGVYHIAVHNMIVFSAGAAELDEDVLHDTSLC